MSRKNAYTNLKDKYRAFFYCVANAAGVSSIEIDPEAVDKAIDDFISELFRAQLAEMDWNDVKHRWLGIDD